VVLVGVMIVVWVLPYGLWWFAGALLLAVVGVLLITPKWIR